MAQLLSEEFQRMQKLAGIESINKNYDNEVIEILTELYLYEHYYSKGILKENLTYNNISEAKNKIKKYISKVTDKLKNKLSKPEIYSAILLSKLKQLTDTKTYNKLVNIYKNYKGSSNRKEIESYLSNSDLKLEEGIMDLFRNKKGSSNLFSKSVIGLMVLLLAYGAINKNNINKDNITQSSIEQTIDDPPSNNSNENNIDFAKAAAQQLDISTTPVDAASETADNIVDTSDNDSETDTETQPSDDNNPVTVSDDGKTVSTGFNLGDYELSDPDNTAEEIANAIADQVPDGKQFKNGGVVNPIGAISDTPGSDANDNTANDGSKDLKEKRLETAKKLWPKVLKLLKDKGKLAQDADLKLGDGETKVGGKADKDGDKKIQTLQYDLSDTEQEDIPDNTPPPDDTDNTDDQPISPDEAKTYLRNPKLVLSDGNKYYSILGLILPNIIDDNVYDSFIKTLAIKKGDTINDNFITKKIESLESKDPQTKDIENTIKILQWARGVKKQPSSLINNFKKIDNKIDLYRDKSIAIKPGEKGKALYQPGSGTTQNTGFASNNVAENLILELQTDFDELPGYKSDKAKNNLGLLVPIIVSTWNITDINPETNASTLDYISKTYKSSFDTFTNEFPKIKEKISNSIAILNKEKTSTSSKNKEKTSTQTPSSLDKFQTKNPTQSDVTKVTQAINKDSSFKSYLSKIDNVDELANFILALFIYRDTKGDPLFTDQTFASDSGKVRSALFSLNNRIPDKIQEAENEIFTKFPDVKTAFTHIGRSSTLRGLLKNINNLEEFNQTILRSILPFINSKFKTKTGVNDLKTAIAKAANLSTKYKDILDKKYKKTLEEKPLNESFTRMQKLAGIIKG